MRIALVVDDSKVVRTVSRRIMEELGFEVIEAENGQEALESCNETPPEVILLDWNMPVMSGLEFMKQFRAKPENARIRVIFCTTENDMGKMQEAIQSGANEYVMKPYDKEIIESKLAQLGLL